MNLKSKTAFQIRENFEGKSEKILKINCNNCSEIKKDFLNNINCKFCFLESLYNNINEKFNFISIDSLKTLIDSKNITLILDYFKRLKKVKLSFLYP